MGRLDNQDNELGFQKSKSYNFYHTLNKDEEINQSANHTRTAVLQLNLITEAAQKLSPWHAIRVGTIPYVRIEYRYRLGQCFPDNQSR